MIKERKQEDEAHMDSMQLLGALKVNPMPIMPKISLLLGVQVKEAKRKQVEVAITYMNKVTKGKVNSMGKKKQHFKHRKCRCLLSKDSFAVHSSFLILAHKLSTLLSLF